MYERFTDRARKVMQLANEEAQRVRHKYIGTEHILLGLIRQDEGVAGVAAQVLKKLNVDADKVRRTVEWMAQSGLGELRHGKLPQTPRAKRVIEFAIEEARTLNHTYIGTEHLLLGLLREEGVAAQVLMNLGLSLKSVREEVMNLLVVHTPATMHPHDRVPPSVEDLLARLSDLPAPAMQALHTLRGALLQMDDEIDQLQMQKETAVAEGDFERAAAIRDQVDRLRKSLSIMLRESRWLH
jgi:ATP-dependent Clp protease ATP-binding subunit ClpA